MRQITNDELWQMLREFEQRYGMPSEVFYDRFRDGEMGDADEIMEWAGLCYSAVRNGVL